MSGARMGRFASALFLCAALLLPVASRPQGPVFTAQVDRREIALGETVLLTVTLGLSGEEASEVELPLAPDFDVVSRSQSDSMSFQFGIGGAVRQKTRTWLMELRPRKEGELLVEPGVAVVGGVRHRTSPITIRVRSAHSLGASPFPGASREEAPELFVQAQVESDEVYVGEQVVLSIHLYARVDISNVGSLQLPKLDGFWIGDIASPTQLTAQTRTVGGVPYRAYLLSRKALFPLREGKLEIAPASVEVTVGAFPFGRSRNLRRSSSPLEIEVRPLPPRIRQDLPVGGVGSWQIAAEASPAEGKTGEPITFRITASGKGNLAALELPSLPPIDGLRAFEPTQSEKVELRDGRYGGTKTMEVLLVPEREGAFTFPALEWLVFDSRTENFVVRRTEPISVQVRGSAGGAGPAAKAGGAVAEGQAPTQEAIDARAPRLLERRWFPWALALPAFAVAAALVIPFLRRRRGAGEGARVARGAARRALGALASLQKVEDEARLEGIPRILHVYLRERLGRETGGRSLRDLEALLRDEGASAEVAAALGALLESCERERFAPPPLRGRDGASLLREAEETLRAFEMSLGRPS